MSRDCAVGTTMRQDVSRRGHGLSCDGDGAVGRSATISNSRSSGDQAQERDTDGHRDGEAEHAREPPWGGAMPQGAWVRACDMVRGTFSPSSEVLMGQCARRSRLILTCFAIAASLAAIGPAHAQDKPRYGGELVFVGAAEPPSFDGHREETFGMLHPVGPHYNTLLRVDPTDKTGTKVIGDLAESWTVSADKRTYTFKLRHGVKFHDGSLMTSKDVKASYDKIIFPAPNVPSSRQEQYKAVEAVEAPNADTIVFRLKYPEGSFLASVASPWNFIYKADILAKDPRWYEKNVMGTGPFKFVEYVRGSHWVGKKNPDYWDKGKPYLDGYRVVFIQDAAAQVAAIRGERAMIQFRGFTPQQRDTLVQALGNKITVQESPWNCSIQVALNQNKKPFDDKRVRRALSRSIAGTAPRPCRGSPW